MAARTGWVAMIIGVATLMLTACGAQGDGTPTTVATPDGGVLTSPSVTLSETATVEAEGVVVAPGEPVSVPVGSGTLILVLEDIEVTSTCAGRAMPTQAPALGHFVVLRVSATFDGDTYAPLSPETFSLATSEGASQAVSSTDASWACFEEDELLPPFVDDGDTVTGRVVLDSRTDHGRVIYGVAGHNWYWVF